MGVGRALAGGRTPGPWLQEVLALPLLVYATLWAVSVLSDPATTA